VQIAIVQCFDVTDFAICTVLFLRNYFLLSVCLSFLLVFYLYLFLNIITMKVTARYRKWPLLPCNVKLLNPSIRVRTAPPVSVRVRVRVSVSVSFSFRILFCMCGSLR